MHHLFKQKTVILLSGAILLTITILSFGFFIYYLKDEKIIVDSYMEYPYHVAFITDSTQEDFFQNVYESARIKGEEEDVLVEYMGKDLAVSYTATDLLKIAIAAKMDGIIIKAEESDEITALINQAVNEASIPVITVGVDCMESSRQSFVGIGYYELGQLYAEQILTMSEFFKDKSTRHIMVLIKTGANNSSQNIILSGIKEILGSGYNIEAQAVSDEFSFSAEESIRDIMMSEQVPDVLICMDEVTTTCAYQAIVDFNKVGEIAILGYHNSEVIQNAIEKDIIQATVLVDAKQMGESCLSALLEYRNTGYVTGYIPIDMRLITSENSKGEFEE